MSIELNTKVVQIYFSNIKPRNNRPLVQILVYFSLFNTEIRLEDPKLV